ncbi:hypothetical protein RFI_13816 [Reticulomyxa filosa]|uniref:Uncharacterized protein n=1 Tax=Reticulomyxa filosa TaxID=46433 RepID=X6NDH8_RETFI|nr:hypothetical protein RFI_13816 [Reticulomyxa filosa]|eukprot:ETO23367.1 hypothetical protein RFI_13816 [Reticulomyxa filosa]
MLRSYDFYKDSIYRFKSRVLLYLFVYVLVVTTGTLYQGIFLSITYSQHLPRSGLWLCQREFTVIGMLWTAINDTILTFLLTYLFVQRLIIIMNNIEDSSNVKKFQLLDTAIKISLLSIASVISSFILLGIIGLFGINWVVCVDCVVTSICLVLMSHRFDSQYQRVCHLCSVQLKMSIAAGFPTRGLYLPVSGMHPSSLFLLCTYKSLIFFFLHLFFFLISFPRFILGCLGMHLKFDLYCLCRVNIIFLNAKFKFFLLEHIVVFQIFNYLVNYCRSSLLIESKTKQLFLSTMTLYKYPLEIVNILFYKAKKRNTSTFLKIYTQTVRIKEKINQSKKCFQFFYQTIKSFDYIIIMSCKNQFFLKDKMNKIFCKYSKKKKEV